jgi:phosphopentomutase
MRVLYKAPGEVPRTMVIPNELGVLQQLVGGYIEVVKIGRILIIVNEEGKLEQLEKNFRVEVYDDTIRGSAVFVRANGAEFDSLTGKDIEELREAFREGDTI